MSRITFWKLETIVYHRTNRDPTLMWVKQCHVHHPPVITIFIGGISTIPQIGCLWHCFSHRTAGSHQPQGLFAGALAAEPSKIWDVWGRSENFFGGTRWFLHVCTKSFLLASVLSIWANYVLWTSKVSDHLQYVNIMLQPPIVNPNSRSFLRATNLLERFLA